MNSDSANLKENYSGSKKKIKRYANGGEVTNEDVFMTHLADGGDPIAAQPPEGLDSFLNSEPQAAQSAPMSTSGSMNQQQPSMNEPHGLDEFVKEEKYGTPGQTALTALEGAAKGASFGLSSGLETASGLTTPEDIRARAETNPGAATTGEMGGIAASSLIPVVGEAKLLAQTGEGAAKLLGLGKEGASLLSRLGATGVKSAVETAMLQGGDEVSKMLLNDPEQSAQTAVINMGLAAVMGGGIGTALGSVSPLWKSVAGDKLGQTLEDFKSRIKGHMDTPEPIEAVSKELGDYYGSLKNVTDEVYGPQGLKAQDIAKAIPKELSTQMIDSVTGIGDKLGNKVGEMLQDTDRYPARLAGKLQQNLSEYVAKVGAEGATPADMFNATQDLKQALQEYSKFDKFVKPVDEAYDFVKEAKSMAFALRQSLEDSKVWGGAADRQKAINKAFVQFKPALDDFEKKFTTEIADTEAGGTKRVIDPTKVNTFINSMGSPKGDLKKEMLQSFLKAADKYKGVISDTHANLGIEGPIPHLPLNHTMNSMQAPTTGGKLADAFIKYGLEKAGGSAIAAGVGAGLGSHGGHGVLGALLGEHILGPFFKSVLPALARPIIDSISTDAVSAKSAIDYGVNVARSEAVFNKAIKNAISGAGELIPTKLMPTSRDRDKLKEILNKSQTDPTSLVHPNAAGTQYIPDHQIASSSISARASEMLNALKPQYSPKSPLDTKIAPSKAQQYEYDRALDIAQQPLLLLNEMKKGTLNTKDVKIVSGLYPELYKKMAASLMSEVVNHTSKEGNTIPYKTRMGLSLLTGQALDSTMTPTGIMAAQSVFMPTPSAPQGPAVKNKRSTSSLGKNNNMYMTANQSAQADMLKRAK